MIKEKLYKNNLLDISMIKYSLIAAVAKNWVIGNGIKIPWYISEDFKLFKEKTTDSVVIMGETTWNSLPENVRPLPNRINIVLTKNTELKLDGATVCNSIEDGLNEASKYDKEIFIMGGASIYRQTIEGASALYISHVKKEYEGDVFFPEFDASEYNVLEEKEYDEFTFKKYEKIKNS